ncbi:hypothetical protein DVR14_02555 [Natrinema thermotolerans]|nr:hypothetical protein DVR14_02555 [Natrinema thermotolerans]
MDAHMLDLDPTTLGLEFGASALVGGLIGYAAKKIAKLLAIIVGVELMAFRFLESEGIVTVDYERLTAGLLSSGDRTGSWLESAVSTLSIGVGFTSGFLIGYRRG